MDLKLKTVETHNCMINKIDTNLTKNAGLIEFDYDVWTRKHVENDKSKDNDDDEWQDENFAQNDNNENRLVSSSENLVELIEVEDDWQYVNSDLNDFNENDVMASSENLVELIEVEDDCYESDIDSISQVEIVERLEKYDNKSGNCESNVMDVSPSQAEEIEFTDYENDDESMDNGGDTSFDSINEFELMEISDPDESVEDEIENRERIGRIAELKKSLMELKDYSNCTKRGLERKRRAFKLTHKERATVKLQLKQALHYVRKACGHDICKSNMSKSRRKAINEEFWKMGFSERKTFGYYTIDRHDIKQRRKNTEPLKKNTFAYYLKNDQGSMQQVCKTFYLTTLGFSKRNDTFIKTLMGKTRHELPLPRSSNHGKHLKPRKEEYEIIISHINSFDPNISHHRREHAPKKKYLPNNLTIRLMYDKFKQKYPDIKCSYYLYRRIVSSELNISFTKLGHEQCETCEEHDLHVKSVPLCDYCELCEEYEFHKTRYTESRGLYFDQRGLNTPKKAYTAGDMEKVIMLPRLEMFKTNIFSTRLSAYNDTFAPLGGSDFNPPSTKPVAVLWHEGISGRCKEDIISAFYKFFIHKREVEEHVMWLDNCSSQNKNWALLCFLVYIINSNLIEAQKIQFNYFEPGHTFMAADSFHYQVELSMKRMEKVYNFQDFEIAVGDANSQNVTVLSMEAIDFKNWIDGSSRAKKKAGEHYLHEMEQITAIRGSYDLTYKKRFSSPEEFHLDFLQEKYKINGIEAPIAHTNNCGISAQRKANILATGRIIPEDKIDFWKNIDVIDESSPNENTLPRGTINRQNKGRQFRTQHKKCPPRKIPKSKRNEIAQCKKSQPKVCPTKDCQPKKCPPKKTQPKNRPANDCQPKKTQRKNCPTNDCQPKKCPPKTPPKKCPSKICELKKSERQKSRLKKRLHEICQPEKSPLKISKLNKIEQPKTQSVRQSVRIKQKLSRAVEQQF